MASTDGPKMSNGDVDSRRRSSVRDAKVGLRFGDGAARYNAKLTHHTTVQRSAHAGGETKARHC
eukprot:COSAG01_NODE_44745_length_416_cov_0.621451_1_plen_63_part_10